MKYLLLLFLVSCSSIKPECELIDREETIDGLKLTYKCGNDIIYRFRGVRE